MTHQRTITTLSIAFFASLLIQEASAAVPINLGTLGTNNNGQNASVGVALNASNQVVGKTTVSGTWQDQPFSWTSPTLSQVFVGNPGGSASDINNSGQIVGRRNNTVGPQFYDAFQYTSGSGTTLLPSFNPTLFPQTYATGNNNLNDVVGVSETAAGTFSTGTVWIGGVPSMIAGLNLALDINDSRLIVGESFSTPSMARAYDYSTSTSTAMGTLGGNLSRAYAVNNSGVAVGYSADSSNDWHAFAWDSVSGMSNLGGAATGASESFAWDINNLGTIVGSLNFSGNHRAFCWANGQFTDLNSLLTPGSGWVLERAYGVNDQGWITGVGTFNGQGRAFLFHHRVPEPSASILAALSCGVYGAFRRRG